MCIMEKNTEVVLKFMRSIHRTTNLFSPQCFPGSDHVLFCLFFLKRGESCISRVGRSDKKELLYE